MKYDARLTPSRVKRPLDEHIFITLADRFQKTGVGRAFATQAVEKIEVYLDYIESSDYYNEYGLPSVDATRILLRLTHGCDPEIHELVKRCEAWTKENRAQLVTTYGE